MISVMQFVILDETIIGVILLNMTVWYDKKPSFLL